MLALAFIASTAQAQSFEAGVHITASQWSEFDGNDRGIGGRVSWKPVSIVGIDAAVTWYPSDFPERIGFSRARVEGLFGLTVGPRVNRVRPFVSAAAGFLDVKPTSGAFACIAIFPPPLNCVLAGGRTMPAYEIGGGIEIDTPARTFIRGDAAQRFLKYPGPTFRDGLSDRVDEDFFGGALRFTLGAGVRF